MQMYWFKGATTSAPGGLVLRTREFEVSHKRDAEMEADGAPPRPALVRAAADGDLLALQELLATSPVNVDVQDETTGDTPLHAACARGLAAVARVLMDAGASLDVRNERGDTVLHAAASGGDAALVQMLMAEGVEDVDVQNEDGWTPAHVAVENGWMEVLVDLVNYGADESLLTEEGDSLLHVAAAVDSVDAIKFLLRELEMDVDLQNKAGQTALHQAAARGSIGAIKELLVNGATLEAQDQKNATALFLAAMNDQHSVMELLLGQGADANAEASYKWMSLHAAAQSGNMETIKLLIDCGADLLSLTQDGLNALHVAAVNGWLDVVELVVECGLDVHAMDKNEQTPLFRASLNGHCAVVAFLADRGADVNAVSKYGWTPLHAAAQSGDVETIKLLIQRGADLSSLTPDRLSMLHIAAANGCVDAVKFFVESGLDVHASNDDKQTPLYRATLNGHHAVVELLLHNGADVYAVDKNRWTLLHIAAEVGNMGTIKLLVEHGADLHSLTQDGLSVLHIAAAHGGFDAVAFFVETGLDIHAADENEQTPVFRASVGGHFDVVEFLLEKGADVNAVEKDGWTPLHGAADSGDVETIKLLVERGADLHSLTNDGRSATHCAALSGCVAAVEFLTSLGVGGDLEDVNKVDEDGVAAIHYAAEKGDVRTIKLLLKMGADVGAKIEKDGWSALHNAAHGGSVEAIELLLQEGADINAKDNDGTSVLHIALNNEDAAVAKFLLMKGADVKAVDESNGQSAFLYAAEGGNVELLQILFERGEDVHVIAKDGRTALHLACSEGKQEAVEYLVGLGVDVNATDEDGRTALHYAASAKGSGCVSTLLNAGATDSINLPDKDGYQALHLASEASYLSETKELLEAGAHVLAVTKEGASPLQLTVFASSTSSTLSTASVLCRFGAEWTTKCEEQLMELAAEVETGEVDVADERYQQLQWCRGLRACILHWESQHRDGKGQLTTIPMEVVQRGAASVKTYLADATSSSLDELVYRCKVCVVGPSEWGKSSLVRSIETMKPFLVNIRDRTIGVELVPTSLRMADKTPLEDTAEPTGIPNAGNLAIDSNSLRVEDVSAERPRHDEATFWDFAGQDVYQVAHSLFFSRRTVYVLVVDVAAYLEQLSMVQSLKSTEAEAVMNRFMSRYVFRWVRMIFACQTDAEFLVLGTKVDLLDDEERQTTRVWRDLQSRVYQWKRDYMRELEAEYGVAAADRTRRGRSVNARIQELKEKLTRLASDKWLVVSVTRPDAIDAVREALQRTIEASERGFPMWNKYSRVLQVVAAKREASNRAGNGANRLELGMMHVRSLCGHLMDEVDGLTYDECCEILRTLHDLGDVIWYERAESGQLRDFIILDPMLVIDVVRNVISHEHAKRAGGAEDNEGEIDAEQITDGRVSHSMLTTFPLWKHMDKEMVYAFKMLLQRFQLAYPADEEVMDPESDLIVPSYWNARLEDMSSSDPVQVRHATETVVLPNHHCWEYEVSADLAPAIFQQFAVQSYTSFMKRDVRGSCIESRCPEFESYITLLTGATKDDVIRVEVASVDADIAWLNMRYYLMKLEKVLDDYMGLPVHRYVVVDGKHHALSTGTKAVQDTLMMGRSMNNLRDRMPWLPPDLDWFMSRAWRDITLFREMQMMHLVRDKLTVLQKLVVKGGSPRLYPALWSLDYDGERRVAVLRMLSDLSGRCYHVPIEIEATPAFLAKHGSAIKEGVSLLATVASSSLSMPTLQKAMKSAVSHLDAKSQRAASIHNLIESLDLPLTAGTTVQTSKNSGLSPRGTIAVLRDLLKLHNDSLDELSITEISNLECAATSKGEYVWAHAHEISMLKKELTPCQPRFEAQEPTSPTSVSEPQKEPESQRQESVGSSSKLALHLCIETVSGLAEWDWFKTYCTWQLLYGVTKTPMASGATSTNADNTTQPSWSSLKMPLDPVESVQMLQECRLVVQVKRRSRIGWTKLIGEGEVDLRELVSTAPSLAFSCDPIEVTVQTTGSTTRVPVIRCHISAA